MIDDRTRSRFHRGPIPRETAGGIGPFLTLAAALVVMAATSPLCSLMASAPTYAAGAMMRWKLAQHADYWRFGTTCRREVPYAYFLQAQLCRQVALTPSPPWRDPLSQFARKWIDPPIPQSTSGNAALAALASLVYLGLTIGVGWIGATRVMRPNYSDVLRRRGVLLSVMVSVWWRVSIWTLAVAVVAGVTIHSSLDLYCLVTSGATASDGLKAAATQIVLLAALPLCVIRLRRAYRDSVRSVLPLSERRCLRCEYTLLGAPSEICPECGTSIQQVLYLPERRYARTLRRLATAASIATVASFVVQQSPSLRVMLADWRFSSYSRHQYSAVLRLPMDSCSMIALEFPPRRWFIRLTGLSANPESGHVEWSFAAITAACARAPDARFSTRTTARSSLLESYACAGRVRDSVARGWLDGRSFEAVLELEGEHAFVRIMINGHVSVASVSRCEESHPMTAPLLTLEREGFPLLDDAFQILPSPVPLGETPTPAPSSSQLLPSSARP